MLRSWPSTVTHRRFASRPFSLTQAQTIRLTLIALTVGGFALRLGLLAAYPLREDEATYAVWARRWLDGDRLFLHTWPDKPPLFLWLLAGLFGSAGPSAAAGRWLNIAAGTLTIPVVAAAARRLWDAPRAGVVAGLLVACSPFAVSFSPTIYTDPLLVLLGSAAVTAALWARPRWAGALLAAAIMTKQQGVLYAPLVLALVALPVGRGAWARLGRGLAGLALVALPIMGWDSLRWASAPSPWALAGANYAPLTIAPVTTWGPRVAAWGGLLWYLAAAWPVWAMLAAAGVGAAMRARRDVRLALILGWGLAFVAVHVTTTVQVWDRYLLPLAPWLAWVASGPLARALGGAVGTVGNRTTDAATMCGWKPHLQVFARGPLSFRRVCEEESLRATHPDRRDSSAAGALWARNDNVNVWLSWATLVGLLLLARPAGTAAVGGYPIGGDHGDYAGLKEAFAWLEATVPGPYVLYHQPLGRQANFYLYDELDDELKTDDAAPGRVDLRWFPSAVYLADNAAKTPYPPKFVVIPDWATPRDLELQLALRGLVAETRLRVGRFSVVEIIQPPRPVCDWCVDVPRWTPRVVPPWTLDPARMCLP